MQERVERLIEEEETKCRERLAPYRARLEGKRAVLFTGGVKTWSMVNALAELGVEILAAGTQNSTLEDFYRMKALMHKDARIIEDTSTAGLLSVMYEKMPDLIVAGGKTKFLALKTKTPFLDINHGRSHPYAGYEGMVTFARQLDLTVNNPIWAVLNDKAPWEKKLKELAAAVARVAGHSTAFLNEDMKESRVKVPAKIATVNPQKNSPALGATLAYLGIDGMLGLLHGAQGCSTFIRLQLSRHFKESIALNSTSMSEDTAIFGGWENLKKGIKRVIEKFGPEVVGVMTSGLTETMGDDVRSAIVHFRQENPEFAQVPIIHASTPDYCGSMQEGYAAAVEAIVEALPLPPSEAPLLPPPIKGGEQNALSLWERDRERVEGKGDKSAPSPLVDPNSGPKGEGWGEGEWTIPGQVNLLPGCHLTPADVEEMKEIVEAFGLIPVVIPDISNALDGHIDEKVSALSVGGVTLEEIRRAGQSEATLYFGDSLAKAAEVLKENFQIPCYGFTSITGLAETDRLMETLSAISGRPVPEKFRRWRSRLMDAMVDCHYQFGLKRVSSGS